MDVESSLDDARLYEFPEAQTPSQPSTDSDAAAPAHEEALSWVDLAATGAHQKPSPKAEQLDAFLREPSTD